MAGLPPSLGLDREQRERERERERERREEREREREGGREGGREKERERERERENLEGYMPSLISASPTHLLIITAIMIGTM